MPALVVVEAQVGELRAVVEDRDCAVTDVGDVEPRENRPLKPIASESFVVAKRREED